MILFNHICLVDCKCGHGGHAWHFNNTGKCSYQNCICSKLNPFSAIITKSGKCYGEEDVKTISGQDFVKYYNENYRELVWK